MVYKKDGTKETLRDRRRVKPALRAKVSTGRELERHYEISGSFSTFSARSISPEIDN